jgi:hypothetical protein
MRKRGYSHEKALAGRESRSWEMRKFGVALFAFVLFVPDAQATKPQLQVCQGPVCTKWGSSAVLKAARSNKDIAVVAGASGTCLKGCGKGVTVSGKGLGKKLINVGVQQAGAAADAGKVKAVVEGACKKLR